MGRAADAAGSLGLHPEPADAVSASGESPSREARFWLELREPHRVPELKGDWPARDTAKILREFMAARPSAYITVITIDDEGPLLKDGPQCLQALDGRSMSTGRRHMRTTHEAHAGLLPAPCDEPRHGGDASAAPGRSPAGAVPEGQAPQDLSSLRAEIDTLRTALEPFADFAREIARTHPGWDHDWFEIVPHGSAVPHLILQPFRAALAILTPTQETPNAEG